MAARVSSTGKVYQLDRPAEPEQRVTEEDVQQPSKLARMLMALLKDVADIKRRFFPRRIDFEDVEVDNTGGKKFYFHHNFGGRVRWWPVDVVDLGGGQAALTRHADSDNDTLVLVSNASARVTIRVESAG